MLKKQQVMKYRSLLIIEFIIILLLLFVRVPHSTKITDSGSRFVYTAAHLNDADYVDLSDTVDLAVRLNPNFKSNIKKKTKVLIGDSLKGTVTEVSDETFIVDLGSADYVSAGMSGVNVLDSKGNILGVVSSIASKAGCVSCVAIR